MKKVIMLFSTLTLLFWGQVANANGEIDLLNLDSYLEGDTPPYGEYVIVKRDEKTGVKWITRAPDVGSGTIKFTVNLS